MLVVLVGTSLTGKTTWARSMQRKGFVLLSRDVERVNLFGEYRNGNKQEEREITEILHKKTLKYLTMGKKVILDNTHLKSPYISNIISNYSKLTDIKYKVFPLISEEEYKIRNYVRSQTGKFIPFEVWKNQCKNYNILISKLGRLFKENNFDSELQ